MNRLVSPSIRPSNFGGFRLFSDKQLWGLISNLAYIFVVVLQRPLVTLRWIPAVSWPPISWAVFADFQANHWWDLHQTRRLDSLRYCQGLLTFGHTPLNTHRFLTSDLSSLSYTFADTHMIKLKRGGPTHHGPPLTELTFDEALLNSRRLCWRWYVISFYH